MTNEFAKNFKPSAHVILIIALFISSNLLNVCGQTPDCDSIIIDPETNLAAACVKTYANNDILNIKIEPKEGFGLPNKGSLVEMQHLKMSLVPVGEIQLGYGEDISLRDATINYVYEGQVPYPADPARFEDDAFVAAILRDIAKASMSAFVGVPIPLGVIETVASTQLPPPYEDNAIPPNGDPLKDNNNYDQCIIAWPDQIVKFSGDVIDKGYVDYPNYVEIEIPFQYDSQQHSNKMRVYVKVLLDKLNNIAGSTVGDRVFRYASTEFDIDLN